jgi:hypothetical protein
VDSPEPRIAVVPDSVKSAGPQLVKLARVAGITLDAAQSFLAEATTGVDEQGRWSAYESVVFAPRQNLKTEYLIARILAGLFLFGEHDIVFSAHATRTTTRVFRRLRRAIDRSPALGARIGRVSNRIGAETVELTTGQTLECVARSVNSGRGFTGDLVILDEAHEVDADTLSALLPMLSTRPNPSVLYALSLGNENTSHLGGLRERALAGDPDICWVEWSLGDDDDVADRRVWSACNPAVAAGRISMGFLERQFAALGPDAFAREHLGRSEWPSGAAGEWGTIPAAAWDACAAGTYESVSLGPSPVLEPVRAAVAEPLRPDEWGGGAPPWVRRRGVPPALVGR